MKKSELKSISVMATGDALREVKMLIASVRIFYDCPIYIVCDDYVYTELNKMGLKKVHLDSCANPSDLKIATEKTSYVKRHNDFHSAGAIWTKIGALEWALRETGETLFLDADIVLNQPVHKNINLNVDAVISPHYHGGISDNQKYGVFNAGYVFAKHQDFGKVWKEIYLTRSTFYEQQGMIWFFEYFNMGIFDKNHNIGFWRFEKKWVKGELTLNDDIDWLNAKSFHFHSFPETYKNANRGLKKGYDLLKEKMLSRVRPELHKIYKDLENG